MAAKKISKIQSFQGLISAPFTAFTTDGKVNSDVIPEYIDLLVSQGVTGAFVNGTTGEGISLTVAERKTIAEKWVKYGKDKFEVVIIHIGANSLRDAQELARHAEEIGATGIAALPPFFFKPPTHEHLVEYYKQIAEAAPNLPLIMYHIPFLSGVEISLAEFLPKVRKVVPTFIGAKFTSIDVRDLLQIQSLPGEPFKIITGFEEVLLPCLSCGVTAAIGAVYNFMAPLSLKIVDAYKRGNIEEARKYQTQVVKAIATITRHGQGVACSKATMNLLGPIDFGQPRAPVLPLDIQSLRNLKEDLKNLKTEEWRRI